MSLEMVYLVLFSETEILMCFIVPESLFQKGLSHCQVAVT